LQSDFFGQLAFRHFLHVRFARIRPTARNLPGIAPQRVAPLPGQHDLVAVVDGNDTDRGANFNDSIYAGAAIRPHKPFTELSVADWEYVRGVVLDGALYLTRALIDPMVKNKYGRILFFVGDGAFSGRGAGRAHISAAKMGLIGLARGLASEFAPHNIRVNVVSPGSIDTRRDNPEWYHGRVPDAAGIPLGRQGTVDEIAATCLFLVSDDGGFITGQTVHVNGGAAYY